MVKFLIHTPVDIPDLPCRVLVGENPRGTAGTGDTVK